MRSLLILLSFVFFSNVICAQPTFIRRNFIGSQISVGPTDICTTGTGFILYTGDGVTIGNARKIVLWKTDMDGNLLWTKKYLDDSVNAFVRQVRIAADGNYFIAGYVTFQSSNWVRQFVMKTDTSGQVIWFRYYHVVNAGGTGVIVPLQDTGFILTGTGCGGNHHIERCNPLGYIIWQHQYAHSPGPLFNVVSSVLDQNGQNIVMFGIYSDFGNWKARILKTDIQNGNVVWCKSYELYGDNIFNHKIFATSDGYLVTGQNTLFTPWQNTPFAFKTDTAGNLIWQQVYDFGSSVQVNSSCILPDGSLIIANNINLPSNIIHPFYMRIDGNTGMPLWSQHGESASIYSGSMTAAGYNDNNGILMAGTANGITFNTQIDFNGNGFCDTVNYTPLLITPLLIQSNVNCIHQPMNMIVDSLFVFATVVTHIVDSECENPLNVSHSNPRAETHIYPNPASDYIYVSTSSTIMKVQVFSLTGELLITEVEDNGCVFQLDTRALTVGCYFLLMYDSSGEIYSRNQFVIK